MKEYVCVQVTHHRAIGRAIGEWEEKGWRLHTYSSAGTAGEVKHYLLFEKGESVSRACLEVVEHAFADCLSAFCVRVDLDTP